MPAHRQVLLKGRGVLGQLLRSRLDAGTALRQLIGTHIRSPIDLILMWSADQSQQKASVLDLLTRDPRRQAAPPMNFEICDFFATERSGQECYSACLFYFMRDPISAVRAFGKGARNGCIAKKDHLQRHSNACKQ
jgi:hypothetical protein